MLKRRKHSTILTVSELSEYDALSEVLQYSTIQCVGESMTRTYVYLHLVEMIKTIISTTVYLRHLHILLGVISNERIVDT